MKEKRYQILLTNDDGIQSPGLWAAAEALSKLGFVTVAAPRDQASSTGRSLPSTSDGKIHSTTLHIGDQDWPVYAVGGTPAQVVLHAVLEIMPERPDLVVSGINYGENIGSSITVSGTVGAVMEAASLGIPGLAASLQLDTDDYFSYSRKVDFSTAAYFTQYFARMILEHSLPQGVDLLKIDVPTHATPETPWRVTRLANQRYYVPEPRRSGSWEGRGYIGFRLEVDKNKLEPDSDLSTIMIDKMVSVTPLNLDMTARVSFQDLDQKLRE